MLIPSAWIQRLGSTSLEAEDKPGLRGPVARAVRISTGARWRRMRMPANVGTKNIVMSHGDVCFQYRVGMRNRLSPAQKSALLASAPVANFILLFVILALAASRLHHSARVLGILSVDVF